LLTRFRESFSLKLSPFATRMSTQFVRREVVADLLRNHALSKRRTL